MTRPSKCAVEMFDIAEKIFREYAPKWLKNDTVKEMLTDMIIKNVEEINIPECHRKLIIKRFVRIRLFWLSAQESVSQTEANVDEIKAATGSSKSTAAKAMFK